MAITEIDRGSEIPLRKDYVLSSNGEGIKALIERVTGIPFAPDFLKDYPFQSHEFEPSQGELRERFVSALLDLENLMPGLGHEYWRRSRNLSKISRYNTSHLALNIVYNGPNESVEQSPEAVVLARMGIALPDNGTGVRNRGRIVQKVFADTLRRFPSNGGKFNVLGVAAGSGEQILQAIVASNRAQEIKYLMVDRSTRARLDGRELAKKLGIEGSADFLQTEDASNPDSYLPGKEPFHLAEGVGIFDYWKHEVCVKVLKALEANLVKGGTVLFANIAPNQEIEFLERVVGWKQMKYREGEELWEMAKEAGFEDIKVIEEPVKMYNIITARKAA